MPRRKGIPSIGTSGYQYDHWRGIFYPPEIPKKDWFGYYATRFDTVEINNTFYNLPSAQTFDAWRERAPRPFCYALKFSRYGTHLKRLREPEETISLFLERAERLDGLLGPILVQLPPRFAPDAGRLDAFLAAAPKRHRWAVEFRDPAWLRDDVYAILRHHGSALCLHDMIPNHPRIRTADWFYLRFHGDRYAGSYSPQKLSSAARWIARRLEEGCDVYAYFNNDVHGHAVHNAADLRRYVLR
ncbi:MAG: DUF72 domain-containing protein [Candidatus Eisenbacteria bacterium]